MNSSLGGALGIVVLAYADCAESPGFKAHLCTFLFTFLHPPSSKWVFLK